MNENSANADGIGSMQHAFGAVAEHGAAEALPFVAVVDGEAAENDDRNRFGHVAAEVARRRGCFDAARREGVIADNFRAFTATKVREASAAWFLEARRFSQSSRDATPDANSPI